MATEPPSSASSLQIYLRLLGYVRPFIGFFALSLLGYVMFASSEPMLASVMKYFVDGINTPGKHVTYQLPVLGEVELIWGVPALLLMIVAWRSLGFYLGNYYLARVSHGLVNTLRQALFQSLMHLPNHYFDQNNSGYLISRITYNVTMVTGAATDAIKVVIREGLTIVFLFGYLLWMNWKLTLVMLAVLPVISVLVTKISRKFRKQSRKIQTSMGDLTQVTSEAIQNYRIVRSFGGEEHESAKFRNANDDNTKKQLRMVRTSALFTPALQFITFSTMAVLLFLVLYLRADATAGDIVAYITAAGMLPKPIRQLSEVSATIQKGLAGAESIFAQLDEQPEPDNGAYHIDKAKGHLEVRDLSFTYPGSNEQVLDNISFSARPGQMIALVGRSGSGKSSLVNLIPRFYLYSQGSITLDAVDIREYRLANLRQHIALVSQHVLLFNDSIANNIAYGSVQVTREAVIAAARAAYADEFISRLADGYDTLIGENGVLLSGGQRQRLALARAILKDAAILILDEATSALDTESERHIQAALEAATAQRTTLVIAHRLSTIEKADLILVMEQGRIVEAGRHAELIDSNGAYARLHAMQFRDASA
jgi:subfamily B ATP-binding cassette protein MsbA